MLLIVEVAFLAVLIVIKLGTWIFYHSTLHDNNLCRYHSVEVKTVPQVTTNLMTSPNTPSLTDNSDTLTPGTVY